jgi:hypothetical protein
MINQFNNKLIIYFPSSVKTLHYYSYIIYIIVLHVTKPSNNDAAPEDGLKGRNM